MSCHPQFRRGNKFKSPQEGCNKNETRIETVLGGEEEKVVKGREVSVGRGHPEAGDDDGDGGDAGI